MADLRRSGLSSVAEPDTPSGQGYHSCSPPVSGPLVYAPADMSWPTVLRLCWCGGVLNHLRYDHVLEQLNDRERRVGLADEGHVSRKVVLRCEFLAPGGDDDANARPAAADVLG